MDVSLAPFDYFPDHSVTEGTRRAAELGVDGIEFGLHPAVDHNAVAAVADECNLSLTAIASSTTLEPNSHPSLTADDDSVPPRLIDEIDTAVRLGADALLVTGGPRSEEPAVDAKRIRSHLLQASEAADCAGITILLEPLNPVDFSVFPSTIGEAIHTVDGLNVDVALDTYHVAQTIRACTMGMKNTMNAVSMTNSVMERIQGTSRVGAIHLADGTARTRPGYGWFDADRVYEAIGSLDSDATVCCEYTPPDEANILPPALEKLQD